MLDDLGNDYFQPTYMRGSDIPFRSINGVRSP